MAKYGLNKCGLPNHEQKSIDWLECEYPELHSWLEDMTSYLCIGALADIKDFGNGIRVTLYTDLHEFHISASRASNEDGGYLGLTFSMRDTGAGNDMHDGSYNKECFDQIMKDIVSTVLISLARRDDPNHYD